MITLTTEQAQQIEWALNGISNHPQLGAVINTGPCKEALSTIRAARAQEQAEQSSEAATPTTLAGPVAFVSDVYQSRYTLEWNGRSLPVGTLLYDHSLSLAVRQELEHKAEEAECVKLSLDKAGVPTADASGKAYSLWGRVCRYVEQAEQEPTVSDGVCGGCAKKAADGWALYCVECWEKAEQPVSQEYQDHLVNQSFDWAAMAAKHQFMEGYRIGLAEMREKCAKVVTEHAPTCSPHWVSYVVAIRAINFEGDTGFRPVSEMIAEHKQDPKKAAAIEKAKMRKAEQKPVAIDELARACNLAGIEYKDFLRIKSHLPIAAPVQQVEQEPVHSVGDNYEHFTSYMGAEHSALLCQAYFDGANAPHEEYEAYMEANPAKQHPSMDITIEPHGGRCVHSCDLSVGRWNLYAAPVRTKDLTDEEQLELARSSVGKSRHWLVAAVIAADRELNR